MDNDEFDEILKDRYVPRAPEDLDARIVAASRALPQQRKLALFDMVRTFIEDLVHIPQPAVALAIIFVIGFSLGVTGHGLTWGKDLETDDLSSFLVVEDDFIAEEFLEGVSL